MIQYDGQEVAMVNVSPSEEITVRFESGTEEEVEYDDLEGDEKEISDEFERLLLLHKCLGTIEATIKPTDGPEGSNLEKVRKTLLG